MTRDEAIKILAGRDAGKGIDDLVAKGVLTLEEEPRPTLWKILRKYDVPLDKAQWICNEFQRAGLQIVEKGNE